MTDKEKPTPMKRNDIWTYWADIEWRIILGFFFSSQFPDVHTPLWHSKTSQEPAECFKLIKSIVCFCRVQSIFSEFCVSVCFCHIPEYKESKGNYESVVRTAFVSNAYCFCENCICICIVFQKIVIQFIALDCVFFLLLFSFFPICTTRLLFEYIHWTDEIWIAWTLKISFSIGKY